MLRLDDMLQAEIRGKDPVSNQLVKVGGLNGASGQSRTDDRLFMKPLRYPVIIIWLY